MEIKSYREARDIPEEYLESLVKSEIECWGSRPFDEFMRCTNDNCWKMYSIEDVYWSVQAYRERKEYKRFLCECWCEAELFYKPEQFIELVREYIRWEVSAVLLVDSEKIEWFWIIHKTTLWDLLSLEFSTRPWSYDKNELLKWLSLELFGIEDASNNEVIVLHHIFVSEIFRWSSYWKNILEKLLMFSIKWIPFLLETRYDSSFYAISRSLWFQNFQNDQFWYVIQFNNQESFLSLDAITKFLSEIWYSFNFYKNEALRILDFNPEFSLRKIYI